MCAIVIKGDIKYTLFPLLWWLELWWLDELQGWHWWPTLDCMSLFICKDRVYESEWKDVPWRL